MNPPVFWTVLVLVIAFVAFGAIFTEQAAEIFPRIRRFISEKFGWFYVLTVAGLLGFVFWLILSPHGSIRLGKDDDRPEFTTVSWFSMLFSAGMGIGLLFFGVAEPLMHYARPARVEGRTPEAAVEAMATTFFHWGPHAWAIYATLGASLAYFAFRKDLPLSIRSALYPFLEEKVHGPIGHAVDIFAVWGTIFGLATSLGFGAQQVNAGLTYLFGIPLETSTQLVLIALITAAATLSLVSGLDKGIRILSQTNVAMGAGLLLFMFVFGPTLYELELFSDGVGRFLSSAVERTFWTDSQGDGEWLSDWTFFYWGWWIAWAPFVGLFIARISRGRTVREFVLGVLLAPTAVTFVWFGVFGAAGLYMETHHGGLLAAADDNVATVLYVLLEEMPLATLSSGLTAIIVTLFFVTSSDSGSFVVDMITSGGHPNPPKWQRIFWASTEGMVAAVLLVAGGLEALQAAAIATGLPFSFVLIASAAGLATSLRADAKEKARQERLAIVEELVDRVSQPPETESDDDTEDEGRAAAE